MRDYCARSGVATERLKPSRFRARARSYIEEGPAVEPLRISFRWGGGRIGSPPPGAPAACGWGRSQAQRNHSTSRQVAFCAANCAARLPPRECAINVGSFLHVRPNSSASHSANVREVQSGGRLELPESREIGDYHSIAVGKARDDRRPDRPAALDPPCSRTSGGPSPASSTAVDTPATWSRRSVTGSRSSIFARWSSPIFFFFFFFFFFLKKKKIYVQLRAHDVARRFVQVLHDHGDRLAQLLGWAELDDLCAGVVDGCVAGRHVVGVPAT